MKTIGIIGGLSWHSTLVYYKEINRLMNERIGGSHSAKILLHSIDFHDFKELQEKDDWIAVERMFSNIAINLQNAGAECILIATNAAHVIADDVRDKLNIPLFHIAEETAKAISSDHVFKVGLIGTKFVMEKDYFKDRLAIVNVESIIPTKSEREFIHNSIFSELTIGVFKEETRKRYVEIINDLKAKGAQAIVFACTELSLLINPEDLDIPVFDTMKIHTNTAVNFAAEAE